MYTQSIVAGIENILYAEVVTMKQGNVIYVARTMQQHLLEDMNTLSLIAKMQNIQLPQFAKIVSK
jgi:hypothetical protein